MDMQQYLNMFIEESKEHLQSMNECLLNLEKSTNDKNLLNEIFRVSHTIKGMAATMGFTNMADLTHEMENLLHEIRNDEIKINTEIIDLLFKCLDTLEEHVQYIRNEGEEGNIESTSLVSKIRDIISNKDLKLEDSVDNINKNPNNIKAIDEYLSNVIDSATDKGLKTYDIKITLNENCMLKAARAFIIFKSLEKHSEIIKSNPSVEDIEDEKFDDCFSLMIISDLNEAEIKSQIDLISEVKSVELIELNIDNTSVIEEVAVEEKVSNKEKDEQDTSGKDIVDKKKQTNKVGKTVRVDIDRLDNLMNLVSELIIIKTRMEDIGYANEKQNMNEAIEYLERITTNLHDAVMKVRMVPIERVFNRFPRMVRDLSKELGKDINLKMSGEETEVDRTVIDEIGDPLIHLIRNSIDHGIEKTEDRLKMGKSEQGIVKLLAYPDGNNVVIEVQDDGLGIDTEKVKDKAISKGIITKDVAEKLSKEDACLLLFKPGFSTAEKVTDLSGRGVGLDVVKSKIESIGGVVEVDTVKGKGTKFTIRIPLTLAIIQALLIKLKEEIYAIPLSSIKEITTISNNSIRKIQNQEVVLFRNNTLPIIRLHNIVGLENDNNSDELIIVIVKKGEKEVGLVIDELIGQQEIVIKSLGKFLAGIKHIVGATILGNGRISLILDVNSLF